MDTSVSTAAQSTLFTLQSTGTLKPRVNSVTRTVMWFAASSGLGRRDMAAWGFAGMDPGPIIVTGFTVDYSNCSSWSLTLAKA